jgi:hypothetical protein
MNTSFPVVLCVNREVAGALCAILPRVASSFLELPTRTLLLINFSLALVLLHEIMLGPNTQVHLSLIETPTLDTNTDGTMTCALDSFMNNLISHSKGCSSNMTIISDNARVMQGACRQRAAPKRSRSLPIDRWEVSSRREQMPFVRPVLQRTSDHQGGSLSRWQSLTSGSKSEQSNGSQLLTKPTRRVTKKAITKRDWFASMDKAPQFVKSSKHQDMFTSVQSLPVSLRSLPY